MTDGSSDAYFDAVIVGAGHGGAQAASSLRQRGFSGSIAMIGAEPELPYERPSLSKDYLAGDKPFERLSIRPPAFWTDRNITMLTGREVVAVDAGKRFLTTNDGARISYRSLIWAAGGAPRRLTCDGHDLGGVHAIRTRADVDLLASELADTQHVCVVGAGYIGLEGAAVLRKLGKRVTVLEAQSRVLSRTTGATLSAFLEREHRARGVDLRCGVEVDRISGSDGRACGVVLRTGETVSCDLVITGVGIVPAVGPLLAAGADGGNGVLIDSFCRTSLEGIHAIGDCALHANRYAGLAEIRLESVQNANDMATTAARDIVGDPMPYEALPWFWSNQYDLKLQTIGLSIDHDAAVLRGDPDTKSFSIVYLRGGHVVALDCVNAMKDYVQGKALVVDRAILDLRDLGDPTIPLKLLHRSGS